MSARLFRLCPLPCRYALGQHAVRHSDRSGMVIDRPMQDRIGYPRPILLVVHGAGFLGMVTGIASGPGNDQSLLKCEALKRADRLLSFGPHVNKNATLDDALRPILDLPSLARRQRA